MIISAAAARREPTTHSFVGKRREGNKVAENTDEKQRAKLRI
jgi:hypothetical protein